MSETPYSLAPSPCAFCMCFVIFIFLPTSSVSALYIYIAFKRRESTKTCYLHAFLAYSFFFFCQLWAMPMSKTKRIPQLTSCCIKVVAKKKKSINFCVICDLEGFNEGVYWSRVKLYKVVLEFATPNTDIFSHFNSKADMHIPLTFLYITTFGELGGLLFLLTGETTVHS